MNKPQRAPSQHGSVIRQISLWTQRCMTLQTMWHLDIQGVRGRIWVSRWYRNTCNAAAQPGPTCLWLVRRTSQPNEYPCQFTVKRSEERGVLTVAAEPQPCGVQVVEWVAQVHLLVGKLPYYFLTRLLRLPKSLFSQLLDYPNITRNFLAQAFII